MASAVALSPRPPPDRTPAPKPKGAKKAAGGGTSAFFKLFRKNPRTGEEKNNDRGDGNDDESRQMLQNIDNR